MRIEDVVRYCSFCGDAFVEGDELSMIMFTNMFDPDEDHARQTTITAHRSCSLHIQEISHDEAVLGEL